MELRVEQAERQDDPLNAAPPPPAQSDEDDEAKGPLLGASYGVALQEILMWPFALASAFAWLLQL